MLLTIAGIVAAVAVMNAVYPAVATEWDIATTVKFDIKFDDGCPGSCLKSTGKYFIRVITPNGVAAESYFSM